MSIDSDGTFLGRYQDSNMGETGDEYPNGTEYFCDFSGKFAVPQKIGEYSYRMAVEYLHTEAEQGFTYYENGVRHVASNPYGMENAQEVLLYLPGYPTDQIPEEALSWINCLHSLQDADELPQECYVLYNEEEGTTFLGLKEEDEFLTKQEVQALLNDYFNAKSDGSVRYEVCDEIEEDSEGCYQFTLRSSLTKEAAQELIEAGGQPTPNKLIDSLSVNVQTGQVEMGEETFQLW